jgi:tetratricopeptide (TPR) repeat protein
MFALHALLAVVLAASPAPQTLRQVLESYPADSLPGPLARVEAARRGGESAEAALAMGRLHYARGEYRQAAADFSRAGPRLPAARRAEAGYWTGLSLLGAGEPGPARGAFEEAARGSVGLRPLARLGVALCWEAARRPEKALETLQEVLAGDPGEAGPAALEKVVTLATRLGRPELARRSRERLAKDYPRSVEAVRSAGGAPGAARPARPAAAQPVTSAPRPAPPPTAAQAPLAVQVGVFRQPAAANDLAARIRRNGIGPVRVVPLPEGSTRLYAVRVGVFATAEDARAAGAWLGKALGMPWRLVPVP